MQGHYQPGRILPGEAFLASEYVTSRPIRKAIARLVGEGLLTVAHGRGTFARPTPDRRLILMGGSEREDLLSPTYDPAKQGWEHVTVASEAERTAGGVTPNSALFMSIEGSKADVLGVHRGCMGVYRYAYWQHTKTRARIHLCSYVLADLVATITGEGADRDIESHVEPEDYYAHLEREHGPLRWTTSVHAQMPYGETYEDLGMEPIGTPLLVVRRVMLSSHGRPLEFTEIELPADRFEVASASDYDRGEPGGGAALRV
ncbi:GntR family transcriptional regulator [Streptosporangium sp. NPDC006013]|uniref:GntR family transcriptional regulator n=1 Tax=Streptosporangium sp. NPDC006013 TaxID=3155596 RepID=UPI00339F2874